jgi:hypothetical protein
VDLRHLGKKHLISLIVSNTGEINIQSTKFDLECKLKVVAHNCNQTKNKLKSKSALFIGTYSEYCKHGTELRALTTDPRIFKIVNWIMLFNFVCALQLNLDFKPPKNISKNEFFNLHKFHLSKVHFKFKHLLNYSQTDILVIYVHIQTRFECPATTTGYIFGPAFKRDPGTLTAKGPSGIQMFWNSCCLHAENFQQLRLF